MKVPDKAIPNRLLRNQRKLHYWTQSQVAEQLGTTTVNVNRWESGITSPSLHFRQKLCELFGKSPEELGLISEAERHEQTAIASSALPLIWNVPFRRNPFFTGREDVLIWLHNVIKEGKTAVVTQTQAISGLGGIGKTQTVVEYAYRYHSNYKAILWIKADTRELLISDCVELASLLNLPEKDEQDQKHTVVGVKRWLKEYAGWLLILDNVEDVEMANDFMPSLSNGHILLTTRAQTTGPTAQRIELEKMEPEEGALFLLRRTKRIAPDAPLEQASSRDRANALELSVIMDGLPLALDQAAAYIEETDCGLSGYLARYQTRSATLLRLRGESIANHPEPVATTWSLSFEKVQQANSAAADLLRLCAFLHPDAIPEEIISEGGTGLSTTLEPIAADSLELDVAIRELRKFSLVRRDPEAQLLMIHRLVQHVLKDGMDERTQRQWAERVVCAVNRAFPDVTFQVWQRCQRCLPHAQACAALITQWNITSPEASALLNRAGYYLYKRAQFTEAGTLLRQALEIRKQVLGLEHPDVAETLNKLVELYYEQGKYAQAEPLARRAVTVYEQVLGLEHPNVAESLNNLASVYLELDQQALAESLYLRALAIREKIMGPEHYTVAESLNNLAWLYFTQSKYEQAEHLWLRAISINERQLGFDHPSVALNLNNLGRLYYAQGKYEQAEFILLRALAMNEQGLGPKHPRVAVKLNNLGKLYRAQGKYKQAEQLFQRALAIREQSLGPEHHEVAQTLSDLAKLYHDQDKYAEAEPLYQRALLIFEQALGPQHLRLVTVLENYASMLREMNRETETAALDIRAQTIRARLA